MIHLLLIFTVSVSWANKAEVYTFGDLMIAFHTVDGFTVNRSCLDKKCEALKMAHLHNERVIPTKDLVGGKNPSAVKCKVLMKGSVIIGNDMDGNEQSFCKFEDDSFLK